MRSRATHPYPEWLTGTRNADVKYPLQLERAVARVAPRQGNSVGGVAVLHRTRDRGRSWQVISPDLTGTGDAVRNQVDDLIRGSSAFEPWGTIFAFEESPTTPGLLWSGSDDGLVYLSRDDGDSWVNVTPAACRIAAPST